MKVLIVEDEKHSANKLKRKLQVIDRDITVLAVIDSIEHTVEWLKTNPSPDLIFLDIELADGQSFEIFKRVEIHCPVIFTTAYDEYALKAFEVNSIDYLLKPIKEDDLKKTFQKLDKVKKMFGQTSQEGQRDIQQFLENFALGTIQNQPKRERFLSKLGQRLVSVDVKDIAYFFSKNKFSYLRTFDQKEFMLDYTMDELQWMVDPSRFFRLNRQIIASIESIEKTHYYFNNKLKINLFPPFAEEVLVSREKAAEFKRWLGA